MDVPSSLDDLDLVRTFLVVAEERSLTRAAARLFRTQSALSRRLQSLEEAVGEVLFLRRKTGVVLTEAGSRFVGPARALLSARDHFLLAGRRPSGGRKRLRIACSDTVARYLLAPRLSLLLQDRTELTLELQVSNTPQTIARVAEDEADLGFVLLPARYRGLEFRPVLEYHHMAAYPPGKAPRSKVVSLAAVLENPLVLLDRSTRTRQLIDASLLSRGLSAERITEVGNVSVQKALVRAGLGVGILPAYAKESSDGMGWREIQGATARMLAACYRRGAWEEGELDALLEALAPRQGMG